MSRIRNASRWSWPSLLAGLASLVALSSPAGALALPEGRAYEMVSPPDKNDGDVAFAPVGAGVRASIDGNRLAYTALGGFADAPTNGLLGAYSAGRGSQRWTTRSLMLPMQPFTSIGGSVVETVSPDGTRSVTEANADPQTGERLPNNDDAYWLVDAATGETEPLVPPLDVTGAPYSPRPPSPAGNRDFSRVFFSQVAPLTDDAIGLSASQAKIYMYEDGGITLASRAVDGSPSIGNNPGPTNARQGANWVSLDGSVLYYNTGTTSPLHRRDISQPGAVIVNAEENDAADVPLGNATFVGASTDGSKVFFLSNQQLVAADTNTTNDVYQYDHTKPPGERLTLASPDAEPGDAAAAVSRAHNNSDDGSAVVFASNSQLVEGAPTDSGSKLYLWNDGELNYIANVGSAIDSDLVHLSPDGGLIAFSSDASGITPDDNGGFEQIYVFNDATDEVECISCREGAPSTAPAQFRRETSIAMFASTSKQVRNISSAGEVVFETPQALLPADTNGKYDVYVWRDGELDLISTGHSADDSFYLDMPPSGETMFFITRERLSGWDSDNHFDAYAARVGGGLPEPEPPAAPCSGDGCLNPPPLPPAFPEPGSVGFNGPGNPGAKRDCDRLERKAERLAERVKRLRKRVRKASGKRHRVLKAKAKKVKRKAKRAKRKANRCAKGARR